MSESHSDAISNSSDRPAWGVFEEQAAGYDAWYDTSSGAATFGSELEALSPLLNGLPHPWLEVGVGSGRFATALGTDVGIDPAYAPLAIAGRRPVATIQAVGEHLPLQPATFGVVTFVLTLSFVQDITATLREARRVLAPNGAVIIGEVPATSPLGARYVTLGAKGHPYYQLAHFLTLDQWTGLLVAAGFTVDRVRSSLFQMPDKPSQPEGAREGIHVAANFVAVRAIVTS